ncbi:helix-turn-helix domain-containing protein [Vagococcus elongatus]|uniref:HTH cro/C1-type domain-containing protein n=1 Tax=Vagococcus elongatus TaxID=180344 RepID=A0A430B4M2_9ENTE|nr:helix-turn-helix transcriptional regulator [Vagococcus elongatus]RSU15253.1 hypothetical protein CBF29_02665 [Vagococcus elongatus]
MNDHTYGTNLKKVRKEMKLSQKQLAEDICSQAMLSRIENNEVIPNALIMTEICKRLNISVEEAMNEHSPHSQKSRDWLQLMQYLHQTHQYTQLSLLISQQYVPPAHFSKEELQLYYYYKACALASFDSHSKGVTKLLQESLDCTFDFEQTGSSDMEIILLSELGRLRLFQGETEAGLLFMKKSLSYFSYNSAKRTNIELVRAIYHVGTAFINHQLYDLADRAVAQGIAWAQKNHVLYYLDQLFLLKGIISQEHHQIPKTLESIKLIDTLTSVAVREQNLAAEI